MWLKAKQQVCEQHFYDFSNGFTGKWILQPRLELFEMAVGPSEGPSYPGTFHIQSFCQRGAL